MKKIWMLLVISCMIVCVYGQNERMHYFGAQYLIGVCNYHSGSVGIGASEIYDGTSYYGMGIAYRYRKSEKTELCLGVTATVNKMGLTSSHSWQQTTPWGSGGGTNTSYYDDQLYMISLPVHFRFHFLKYFFIGGGPCLNIHQSKGYKWGVGLEINVGAEYMFKSGLTVSFSPRGQWNWLKKFDKGDSWGMGMDKLSQIGGSFGLGYRFGK